MSAVVVQTHTLGGTTTTITMKRLEVLVMEPSCSGVLLLWRDRPVGEQLQGWYKSKTKARAAAKLVPDAVLDLPLPQDSEHWLAL